MPPQVTRIRHKTDHDLQFDVLDVGERFYTVPGIDFEPTVVSKDAYEPVPQAEPHWDDVTRTVTVTAHKSIGARKVSFQLGAKRIGYAVLHAPYRLRLDGEQLKIERSLKV